MRKLISFAGLASLHTMAQETDSTRVADSFTMPEECFLIGKLIEGSQDVNEVEGFTDLAILSEKFDPTMKMSKVKACVVNNLLYSI